jgi:hypothetical protein
MASESQLGPPCKRLFFLHQIFSSVLVTGFYTYPEHTPARVGVPEQTNPVHVPLRLCVGGERDHEEAKGEGNEKPDTATRHGSFLEVTDVWEAFYAPRAGEGNQILSHDTSKSVETICRHTTLRW